MKPLQVRLELFGNSRWIWNLRPVSPSAPIYPVEGKPSYKRRRDARRAALRFAERCGFEVVER